MYGIRVTSENSQINLKPQPTQQIFDNPKNIVQYLSDCPYVIKILGKIVVIKEILSGKNDKFTFQFQVVQAHVKNNNLYALGKSELQITNLQNHEKDRKNVLQNKSKLLTSSSSIFLIADNEKSIYIENISERIKYNEIKIVLKEDKMQLLSIISINSSFNLVWKIQQNSLKFQQLNNLQVYKTIQLSKQIKYCFQKMKIIIENNLFLLYQLKNNYILIINGQLQIISKYYLSHCISTLKIHNKNIYYTTQRQLFFFPFDSIFFQQKKLIFLQFNTTKVCQRTSISSKDNQMILLSYKNQIFVYVQFRELYIISELNLKNLPLQISSILYQMNLNIVIKNSLKQNITKVEQSYFTEQQISVINLQQYDEQNVNQFTEESKQFAAQQQLYFWKNYKLNDILLLTYYYIYHYQQIKKQQILQRSYREMEILIKFLVKIYLKNYSQKTKSFIKFLIIRLEYSTIIEPEVYIIISAEQLFIKSICNPQFYNPKSPKYKAIRQLLSYRQFYKYNKIYHQIHLGLKSNIQQIEQQFFRNIKKPQGFARYTSQITQFLQNETSSTEISNFQFDQQISHELIKKIYSSVMKIYQYLCKQSNVQDFQEFRFVTKKDIDNFVLLVKQISKKLKDENIYVKMQLLQIAELYKTQLFVVLDDIPLILQRNKQRFQKDKWDKIFNDICKVFPKQKENRQMKFKIYQQQNKQKLEHNHNLQHLQSKIHH